MTYTFTELFFKTDNAIHIRLLALFLSNFVYVVSRISINLISWCEHT